MVRTAVLTCVHKRYSVEDKISGEWPVEDGVESAGLKTDEAACVTATNEQMGAP